ncbi:hypothetical protein FACS189474_4830 [Bacteroidia bacterium]|nr:hypothetical protein FACS189474_4830 [Bacteroidia bacterium]
MKKIISIGYFAFLSVVYIQAQNWQNYVQFNAGMSVEDNGFMFQGEYGKTYKWLDLGVSMDYESYKMPLGESKFANVTFWDNDQKTVTIQSYPESGFEGHTVIALRLNAKIDLIRLVVADSRHALKIGGGFGYARTQYMSSKPYEYSQKYFISNSIKHSWEGSIKAIYEFEIIPNIALGAFFYGGALPACGLSIKRNF